MAPIPSADNPPNPLRCAPRPPGLRGPSPPPHRPTARRRRAPADRRSYDPRYRKIAYPGGDVPRSTGVCADVVVRAARDAWGLDLQRLVHEDMARDFGAYPNSWGLPGPDSNIDHRRAPNLEAWFARQGASLWRASGWTWGLGFKGALLPGDLLT